MVSSRWLISIAALALLSWDVHAATAATVAEPSGYWRGPSDAPVPATLQGAKVLEVRALQTLLANSRTVVVDVSNAATRPAGMAPGAPWLPVPHPAIPGAVWLPGVGAGVLSPQLDEWYRSRLQALTAASLDVPLVIYCHAACWLSWNAAKRAVAAGYRNVFWFPAGIEGWTAAAQRSAVVEAQTPPAVVGLPSLVVLDLELSGDLGGPEFTVEHEARLKSETTRLRQNLAATGRYKLLDNGPAQETIEHLKSQQAYLHDCNGCDLDVGRQLAADLILVAWVDRVSGLILTLTYEMHDVKSAQITNRKSYDFRGDSDNAWNHAIDYMVRDMSR